MDNKIDYERRHERRHERRVQPPVKELPPIPMKRKLLGLLLIGFIILTVYLFVTAPKGCKEYSERMRGTTARSVYEKCIREEQTYKARYEAALSGWITTQDNLTKEAQSTRNIISTFPFHEEINTEEEPIEIPTGALGYMDKICKYGKIHGVTSPICGDEKLYKDLEQISLDVGVPFDLLLGMSYAESHLLANYKPAHCKDSNNPAGLKGFKKEGKVTYGKYPDKNGCRVYRFKSIQSGRLALAHTVKEGYMEKDCNSPACISQYWVGGKGGVKHDWVANVKLFYKEDLAYND